MSKEAIEKVKKFLKSTEMIILDKNESWEDICKFTKSNKSYFVFLERENFSLPTYNGWFCSKRELNKLLNEWFVPYRTPKKDYTSIIIFDVKNDKIVKPHL